ncbi:MULTISPECIES: murein transglycosylase A [Paraburkholderia]|uniref:murein transglycosylase A n=1 Tax=Paraburkholderia TaxID=1822464 RepID=UPI0022596F0B|nr:MULTISPECIES: MltA domain-containing protein [Paraburkholderia]MCX4165864.1 MltA domain-containing protein [Paraburkholderia megapolitana]MDN7161355.1 MltA domain-containing protein [Paraburkholderia sp. CHISQ3]MDQ6498402.1 MltA domain-containing protein [Paraburkholderia megapolitana]
MKMSSESARSDSSANMSIGYSSSSSDMAVSIKSEHCMRFVRRAVAWAGAVSMAVLLAACGSAPVRHPVSPPTGAAIIPGQIAPARLTPVTWQQVPGWADDSLIGATAALRQNCVRLARMENWQRACAAAAQIDDLDVSGARTFFEAYFAPFQLANNDGTLDGLVTGYYEPLLRGSRTRHGIYQTALYRWPAGYRTGTELPTRSQLERSGVLNGNELVWVDDPIEAFFLQVQGSGRVVMEDGSVMRVGFGGTNNQPYRSIGRWLLDRGEVTPAQATMQGIKAWARANPGRVDALLDTNPRFVFFREMPNSEPAPGGGADGPIGALGVPLTPERSIAVDPSSIPLGTPVFLQTTRPLTNQPMNRLVFAQDTGSAIKGGVRADYFWGLGDDAGDLAGKMKQAGRMWLLLPRS